MRISRRLRGVLAAAVTTGALVLPGTALAAPAWTTSSLTSAGPYTSGATATYTLEIVNAGDAAVATGGTITLAEDFENVTVVGTPTVTGDGTAADMSSQVAVTAGSPVVTLSDTFDAGSATVAFVVQLPASYDSDWDVEATGTPGGQAFSESDTSRTVSAGGPSTIELTFPDDAPKWVVKDGTWTSTLTATNKGPGTAEFTRVKLSVHGDASIFSPDWAPNPSFSATGTFTAGCTAVDASGCHLGTLASGESRTMTVTATTLTHFGSIEVYGTAYTADRESWWHIDGFRSVQVTNGKSALVMAALEGPQAAAGATDLAYTGEFVNDGPDTLDAAQLDVSASAFNSEGKPSWSGGTEVESIRSITLSNGAACAPEMDNSVTPAVARMNNWDCPLAGIAPGQRVTFTVIANFPTAVKDEDAAVWVSVQTPTYLVEGSSTSDSVETDLNVEKTIDLQVGATSQALVGLGHVAPVTVTVTNKGNTKAEGVSLSGSARGVEGAFDAATLSSKCSGITKPQFTRCSLGTIEPGATTTFVINVKAGSVLGGLALEFSSSESGTGTEVNVDDNTVTHVVTVAKSSSVPLNAVVFKPKAINASKLLKGKGLNTRVKCPTTCNATVQLWVKRPIAMRMKLRMPKKGDVLVGTSTKVSNPSGTAIVFTKITKKHQKAFQAYRRPVTIQRKTTAVSTAVSNLGATTSSTQNLTVKPAPMKKPRRPRR